MCMPASSATGFTSRKTQQERISADTSTFVDERIEPKAYNQDSARNDQALQFPEKKIKKCK